MSLKSAMRLWSRVLPIPIPDPRHMKKTGDVLSKQYLPENHAVATILLSASCQHPWTVLFSLVLEGDLVLGNIFAVSYLLLLTITVFMVIYSDFYFYDFYG